MRWLRFYEGALGAGSPAFPRKRQRGPLLRQSLERLGVALENAVSRGVELARVGVTLNLDLDARFPANLLEDGLAEDDTRGIAMPCYFFDEGHGPTSV